MGEEKGFLQKVYDSLKKGIKKLLKKEENSKKIEPKWLRICYVIIFYPLSWLLRKFLELLAWLFSKAVRYTSDAIEYTKTEVEADKAKKEKGQQ